MIGYHLASVFELPRYQFDRSMEVLKTAAANEGDGADLMQAGIGQQMAQQARMLQTKLPPSAPPLPPKFHVALDGKDAEPQELEAIKNLVAAGKVNRATLVWREGMANGQAGGEQVELKELFQTSPLLLPSCAAKNCFNFDRTRLV